MTEQTPPDADAQRPERPRREVRPERPLRKERAERPKRPDRPARVAKARATAETGADAAPDQARRDAAGLNENHVRMAYRLMLNRKPSPDEVARMLQQAPTLTDLRAAFLNSDEFDQKYTRLKAEREARTPPARRPDTTVADASLVEAFRFLLARDPSPLALRDFANDANPVGSILNSEEFKSSRRAQKSGISWPMAQMFVNHRARVIYCPIGKVACTFMKRQMVRSSDLAFKDLVIPDIHTMTDKVRTGLQLSDYPESEAQALLENDDFLRLAIVRNPFDRLLSAYLEKFVVRRLDAANAVHTSTVVAHVQRQKGISQLDLDLGITFRDFVTFVCSMPPSTLDPHWRPQSLYLAGVEWDALFPLERINEAVGILEARSDIKLPRSKENATTDGAGNVVAGACDHLPSVLADMLPIDAGSFYETTLVSAVDLYFAEDFELYDRATKS